MMKRNWRNRVFVFKKLLLTYETYYAEVTKRKSYFWWLTLICWIREFENDSFKSTLQLYQCLENSRYNVSWEEKVWPFTSWLLIGCQLSLLLWAFPFPSLIWGLERVLSLVRWKMASSNWHLINIQHIYAHHPQCVFSNFLQNTWRLLISWQLVKTSDDTPLPMILMCFFFFTQ